MDIMRSLLGMVVLLAIAFALSVNKKRISVRTVGRRCCCKSSLAG